MVKSIMYFLIGIISLLAVLFAVCFLKDNKKKSGNNKKINLADEDINDIIHRVNRYKKH
jgi:Flp pilus assembly protein TadB